MMRKLGVIAMVVMALMLAACSSSQTVPPTTQNGVSSTTHPGISITTTTESTANAPYPWTEVDCGASFLSSGQQSALASRFGPWLCDGFRSASEMAWTVLGSGGTVTYEAATTQTALATPVVTTRPGGSMVAVLICPLTNSTCLDPNSTHPFSEFKAYPAPDSTTPLRISTPGMGAPFLALQNGISSLCVDVFDPVTGAWYSEFGFNPVANAARPGPKALVAPMPESATRALLAPAPAPTTTTCTVNN